jgi:hypothetical protein
MSPSSTLGKAKVAADAKTVALITGSNRDVGFETARELVTLIVTLPTLPGGCWRKAIDASRIAEL